MLRGSGRFPVRDEDASVWRNDDVGRLVKCVLGCVVAANSFLAEGHQDCSLGADLEDLM